MRTLRKLFYPAAVAPLFALTLGACVGEDSEMFGSELGKDKGDTAADKLRTPSPDADLITGQYIVRFHDDMVPLASDAEIGVQSVVSSLMAESGMAEDSIVHVYSHAISGMAVRMSEEEALELAGRPEVAYIAQDQIVKASVTWGLDRMDQRNLPLDNTYAPGYPNGVGVHAYVIDTGIRLTHSEFAGRMGNGFDAVTAGGDANDCHGHGTHVAGTVGGTTYGMAPGVTLHPVRVLDCNGSGTDSGVIKGVDWVTEHATSHGEPAVANMSLGGGASQSLDDAVKRSIAAGVVYAVAAGNDNKDACLGSPARVSTAITVGSTTSSDARSSFSNHGTCLDIFAPGSGITSAWHTGDTSTNTISGTSMASPHVAGAVALFLSAEGNGSKTPAEVASALIANATPGKVTGPGANSPTKLLYVGGTTTPPPPPPPVGDVLQKDVPVRSLGASQGQWIHYTMNVPADATNLKFEIKDGTGDADLYVQFGTEPTETKFSCRPYKAGNQELCTFSAPQAGTYHVSIRAYRGFSGVTLTGSYDMCNCGGSKVLLSEKNLSSATTLRRQIVVPSNATSLTVKISGGSGDADLYVKAASSGDWDCTKESSTNNETCTLESPSAGTHNIEVRAYRSFSGLTLTAEYQ